jgi:hypothetical protein
VADLPREERVDAGRNAVSLANYICHYREQRIIRFGHSFRIYIFAHWLSMGAPRGGRHYSVCRKP